jgi:hypothetical protein
MIVMTRLRNGRLAELLRRRSLRAIIGLERNIGLIACLWSMLLAALVLARMDLSKAPLSWPSLALHALIVLSPAIGITLAARFFPQGALLALPEIVLARVGRWRRVDPLTAQRHASFGAHGLMAGLTIGLLLNVLMRTGEFMMAVPILAGEGPPWARVLFVSFAVDCVLFNLLYAAAFIMAVRHVPWFPRMLLLIWGLDIVSQLLIAQWLSSVALPQNVAPALSMLLTGNIQKTLISMALWLPYLLLSERVNVTYRRRIRA